MAHKSVQKPGPQTDLERKYPNLTAWVTYGDRWIEIGTDDYSQSFIRVLDTGGMIWEGETHYPTLDDALAAADAAVAAFTRGELDST